ncbi:MAG TPA: YdcF family protein, partial [Afipia sp.]|nr:YdcF family protein [Afipia sp.]
MLACAGILLFIGLGFVDFLSRVPPSEEKPSRNADGIVVLTGGSSRVSDALELLSVGYGRRP